MDTYRKRPIRYPLFVLFVLGFIVAVLLAFYNVMLGILCGIVFLIFTKYLLDVEQEMYVDTEKYIESLSFRMQDVGEEALLQMPIGILLLNEDFQIEWSNPYMQRMFNVESLAGEEVFILSDELYSLIKSEDKREMNITIKDRKYRVYYKRDGRLLYLFDITEQLEMETQYFADRTAIGILFIDNYDEATQAMDDQTRGLTNSMMTSMINNWAAGYGIFVKRIAADRYLAVFNEAILAEIESTKFAILDEVREKTSQKNIILTLSIGIGAGSSSLVELGELAQSSLDLVLGRGGDQVAIKEANGKLKFYGGKTNPVEKRTRVRARVISHALRDLIKDSDQVFVMGHKNPDMDSIGAAIGVRKMAEMNVVEGYVIVNFNDLNSSVTRLMNEVQAKCDYYDHFITPDEALMKMTDKSLLIIVDTHKPSLVIDSRLLDHADRVVVIDHHRRGEDFIVNPTLVYMEPYASSTAELVTELLEYQPKHSKLTNIEATALLAGIIVDTKSFSLRTGARTFEASAYLRTNGADTALVQRLLKEDIDTYITRSRIVQTVEFFRPGIAIARGEDFKVYDSVLIAQTADILLTMKDVNASFVIAHRADGLIGISARSLSDVNVQLIMEKLGGGGHLSNAAAQLESDSIEEVKVKLKKAIIEVMEGSLEQ